MEEDKLLDIEEKIYIAIPKKDVLPDIEITEEKDLAYYVGTWVIILLITLGFALVIDSYTQRQYNKVFIEFRL